MNENLENVIAELREDLAAQQKELTSKTKQLVELSEENQSLQSQLHQKDQQIEELQIASKISNDNRSEEMYLQIEDFKNELNSKETQKQQLQNDYHALQRQFHSIKTQFDSLTFQYNQKDKEHSMRMSRLETMYKQRIEAMQKMHEAQVKLCNDKLEALKQNELLASTQETEQIKELKAVHDRIEADLNEQIDDMKKMMNNREKDKEVLIQQMNQSYDAYKNLAEQQIQQLTEKLQHYQQNDVEVVLRIEVDDPFLNKPPPKKPAPLRPIHIECMSNHSVDTAPAISVSPIEENEVRIKPPLTLKDIKTFSGPSKSSDANGHGNNKPHNKSNSSNNFMHIAKSASQTNAFASYVRHKLKIALTPTPQTKNRYYGFPLNYDVILSKSTKNVGTDEYYSFDIDDEYKTKDVKGLHKMETESVISDMSGNSLYSDNQSMSVRSERLTASDIYQTSAAQIEKQYIKQQNTRLAEDLKTERKQLMLLNEQSHRKYKQLQIQMSAEKRQWKLKEQQLNEKLEKLMNSSRDTEKALTETQRELHALHAEYREKMSQLSKINPNVSNMNQNISRLMENVQYLEMNNKSLAEQCEKYRREMSGMKQTMLSCNDTMKQQQNQILRLNAQIQDLRKLNGLGGSSSEELLQKQIRLLKSQRRMLIQELKTLREQNDQLKSLIVNGGQRISGTK